PGLFAEGRLAIPMDFAMQTVESVVAGPHGTYLPPDAGVGADRHLLLKTPRLISRPRHTPPGTSTPPRAESPPPEAAQPHRVPVCLVLALIHTESRFRDQAVSPCGAVGLMQVMPAVAREMAENRGLPGPRWLELLDSRTNIETGVTLLRELHDRYGSWDR